jgi:uncharacterized membrane protein
MAVVYTINGVSSEEFNLLEKHCYDMINVYRFGGEGMFLGIFLSGFI